MCACFISFICLLTFPFLPPLTRGQTVFFALYIACGGMRSFRVARGGLGKQPLAVFASFCVQKEGCIPRRLSKKSRAFVCYVSDGQAISCRLRDKILPASAWKKNTRFRPCSQKRGLMLILCVIKCHSARFAGCDGVRTHHDGALRASSASANLVEARCAVNTMR